MGNCIFCQKPIEDGATFCRHCGKKQVHVYTQTFRRNQSSEEEFIQKINDWFTAYPQVANVKGRFNIKSALGVLVNKLILNELTIEYEVFSGENENQYGLVLLQNFGIIRKNGRAIIDEWKAHNPGATIVNMAGGTNQRGSTGSLALGGVGAANKTQLYVLFKFNRKYGTAVMPPQA